jgi:hypothetical protein
MSVDGYDLSMDTDIPRLVAAALRAESWVAGFFGAAGIREHDDSEIETWTPIPPYVAVLPGTSREQRTTGGGFRATVGVRVRCYLPTMIPTVPSVASPAAPTVAISGTGVLTGTRLYATTAYTGLGESCVDDSTGIVATSLPVTYATQKGAVTMPTVAGVTGLRLWATKLNGTALFFHSLAASGAVVTDDLPDASLSLEMAPVRFMGRRIVSALKRALVAREGLPVGGNARAFAAMAFEDAASTVESGVRVHEFSALVPLRGDVITRESTV